MQQKIPLAIPSLLGNERKYLNQCIDTGFVSSVGPFVDKFEKMLREKTSTQHVIVVSSGTCALSVSLVALGVKPGDLVIVPSLTFIATANAIAHCGAFPWIVDISLEDWGINPDLLEEALSMETYQKDGLFFHRKTRQKIAAIIPVYALGLPCSMEKLQFIADKFKIPLVVDAAAGIGSTYHSKPLGLQGGLITTLSFNGNKIITSGGGGAVLSNDEAMSRKIRHISTTARSGPNYDHNEVGYNYRMTNLQAAVGSAQLEQLGEFSARKKCIQEFYKKAFEGIPEITFFPSPADRVSSYWLSGFVLQQGKIEPLIQWLCADDIEAKLFWKPIHLQEPYLQCLKTSTKNSDFIWDKIVTLPSSVSITDSELEKVVQSVLRFFKK